MKKSVAFALALILLCAGVTSVAQTATKKKRSCPVCSKHAAPKDKCADCIKLGKECIRCMHVEACRKCQANGWKVTKACAFALTREGKEANQPSPSGQPNLTGGSKKK